MSCNGSQDCTCGCCSGISVETPQGEYNLPGLPSITYRTGTWASFKESMLARLSSSDYPALAPLKTRDDDDFSIAFLDATAVMLDILTFYQERLANESYLRTATQLTSLIQLSRLIGYEPSPGVSAAAYLAFTLRAATGLPADPGATAITIPAGTQVQSVPAQGQKPQTFQTSADILAKADWNALPVQTGKPWTPKKGDTSAYLAGTATQLNPGDAILIVGNERLFENTNSGRWDLCHVTSVQPDNINHRTLITWAEKLNGQQGVGPTKKAAQIHALRQCASVFGYIAINPLMLSSDTLTALQSANLVSTPSSVTTPPEWDFGTDNASGEQLANKSALDFDAVYSKLAPGGWVVSMWPDIDGLGKLFMRIYLYKLTAVNAISRSDYGISARITRAITDTLQNLERLYPNTRTASLLCQSELLPTGEQPLDHPLYGTFLDLEVLRPDLVGVAAVAVTGKSQKIAVNLSDPDTMSLSFIPDDDPTHPVTLAQGQVLTLLQPPSLFNTDGSIPDWSTSATTFALNVADSKGRTGTVSSPLSNFTLKLAATSDPVVQESALVGQVVLVADPFPHTRILLANPLMNCYDRSVTTVNANVAAATAGAPVTELLGNGSAATPNQQFTLKQSPLTYAQAATPTGSASSLVVRANGAAWTAVPSLYKQPPTAQVYSTLNLPGGTARVQFGDGVEGATLPTGQANIQATYRVGIGTAGNVAAGAISTLVDRPVGVSGVNNPLPATGGQDPQSIEDIRANAPLSVLTLGRAVSITDYQNFAASFAGIARASALWIPNGVNRGVFLTVAAAGGPALPPGNLTLAHLVTALQNYGNPNVAIFAQSFLETTFGFSADLKYDPAYSAPSVQSAVVALLQETYSFANRDFGQGVSGDELAALIQGVAGVVAVNVTSLTIIATSPAGDIGSGGYSLLAYNSWIGQAISPPLTRPVVAGQMRICPYIPAASLGTLPYPAEILVLDPNPTNVVLGVMS